MKIAVPIPPSVRSAPDLVAIRLRDAIFTGELRPGQQLPPESALAQGFGIALMTVRIALNALKEMGLLVTIRGRNGGTFVATDVGERIAEAAKKSKFSKSEIRDLTDWRRGVSGESCYLAAVRATSAERNAILQASENFDGMGNKFPDVRFADARYHTVIAETSKSPSLIRNEIEIQRILTEVILATDKPLKSKEIAGYSHDEITSALMTGNGDQARQAMINHAEATFTWATMLL